MITMITAQAVNYSRALSNGAKHGTIQGYETGRATEKPYLKSNMINEQMLNCITRNDVKIEPQQYRDRYGFG
jgi:hypothetical protein